VPKYIDSAVEFKPKFVYITLLIRLVYNIQAVTQQTWAPP